MALPKQQQQAGYACSSVPCQQCSYCLLDTMEQRQITVSNLPSHPTRYAKNPLRQSLEHDPMMSQSQHGQGSAVHRCSMRGIISHNFAGVTSLARCAVTYPLLP